MFFSQHTERTLISLTVYNSDLSGGSVTESYTTQTGDTLYTVADALSTAVNQDPLLQAVGQTAKAAADVHLNWSQSFTGDTNLQPGSNNLSISATDGGANNTQTDNHQISVNNGTSPSWIYDAVGNFSYGPNQGYSFDPENRFQQLDIFTSTSPGTGTYYDHDALGRCVAITTYVSAVVTSRKIYIWSGDEIIQEQDDSGNVTKDYFALGESRVGTNYFHTKDHLGSIRELTDDSGNIQAQYQYDPYGQATKIQGSLDCDFQYAGYFYEATSGFNLTHYRAYSPSLGRWISRDPIDEQGGTNLLCYVLNDPVSAVDPFGLDLAVTSGNKKGPGMGFHTQICVDERDKCCNKKGKRCFSYGFNPKNSMGKYYEEPAENTKNPVYEKKELVLTCKQDREVLKKLIDLSGPNGPVGEYDFGLGTSNSHYKPSALFDQISNEIAGEEAQQPKK